MTSPSQVASFRTSPSSIARYFFHDCERFLRFASASKETRKRESIPARDFDHSPLVKAILDSGYDWEQTVLEKHLKRDALIAEGDGELHTRRFDVQATLDLLADAKPGKFIYQPTLHVPQSFYDRFDLDPSLVTIHDNHPDLVAVIPSPQGRLLRVLDVKRGDSLKLTHRVQILLYALQLESILEEAGIQNTAVDLAQGAVWLGGQPESTLFDLGDIRPHVESFLRDDLMRILSLPPDDVDWHLYFRCEWCEYFEHCSQQAKETNNISRLAYLTTYGKRFLKSEAGVRTVPELSKFLARKDADVVLGGCASLNGQRPYLQKQITALATNQPELHGAASPALPKGENIALFLTLQEEPLGKGIYLLGAHLSAAAKVRQKVFSANLLSRFQTDEGKAKPYVLLAEGPEKTTKIRQQWLTTLHELLQQVDRHNRSEPDWSNQLSLQVYVHSEQEKALLIRLLMEALPEADLANKVMALLFHFQAPELVTSEEHPDTEVPYPVVVLLDALGRLLALPVDYSYSLPESLAALGSDFSYRRNDYFHFPLGHGLRAEAIHAVWHRGKTENLPNIVKQTELRLFAVAALLRSLRERAGSGLFAWPPKFFLPAVEEFDEPLLSQLAFFTRYENLLKCLEIRQNRSESREAQVLLGQVLELRALNDCEFEVTGAGTMEVDQGTFPGWLLVEDSEAGRRAQLEYPDYSCRDKPWRGNQHAARAIVSLETVEEDELGFPQKLEVSYKKAFLDKVPLRGHRYLLYPRFTDYTSGRIVGFLKNGVSPNSLFLSQLKKPHQAGKACVLNPKVAASAKKLESKLKLTKSQATAYRAICERKFVPVWGPPGTGKTHFLASMILGLATAHAEQGVPFRTLVTAFTHAAIENLLRKLAELQDQLRLPAQLVLGKAKYWQSAQLAEAEVIDEKRIGDWLGNHEHAVLGATVYSCLKAQEEIHPFDLIVVDEASQVRVPESAIPLCLVAPKGRIVLAGDHCQLPPIVSGEYPEPPPGQTVMHRSIFEAIGNLDDQGKHGPCQLVENFRMNDVLTSFAAKLLYGPRYACFDQQTATRRTNFVTPRGTSPLIRACLDPEYPLTVVVLQDVRAAKENVVEASLVADLVACLRQGLREESKPYRSDTLFFRHGVFIVSPHRAQIRTIQRELKARRDWTHTPFVDTVDKMQGQEAEAVIVSYGVADPEYAMQEAKFIYSRNRLNVAMTRARSKCVVCLPQPLLDATPSVLDQPEAAKGLAYMRQLVQLVKESGETLRFDYGESTQVVVYRTKAVI